MSNNEADNISKVRYTNNYGNRPNNSSKFCACYENNKNQTPYISSDTTKYPHRIMVKNVNTIA